MSNILIATVCIGDSMKRSGELSIEINREYATRHKYDFFAQRESLDKTKTPHWTKLLMMKELLLHGNYDSVFYIDCDAVFTNFSMGIEYVSTDAPLTMANENRDIFHERRGENTGTMIMKNVPEMVEFIDDCMGIYEQCKNSCVFEQEAVGRMLETEKWRRMWGRVPCRTMNSYHGDFARGIGKPWNLWTDGDFVMHCLRTNEQFKVEEFGRRLEGIE